jgi:serine/threonine protein kinase
MTSKPGGPSEQPGRGRRFVYRSAPKHLLDSRTSTTAIVVPGVWFDRNPGTLNAVTYDLAADTADCRASVDPNGVTRLAGRYRLGRQIGRGGMADVYAGHDELLNRPVAIKVFRAWDGPADADIRNASEARVLATLNSPGVVRLYDTGAAALHDELSSYLVMELVKGESLAALLRAGPLPSSDVAELGRQLALTLSHVHDHGIVHRDLKPANILMTKHPTGTGFQVKLTDFGIARVLGATRITQFGLTIGTANYLSPEQALGEDVGPASDVYTLGLVLLECLTGNVEFAGHGVPAAVVRLSRAPQVPEHLGPQWGSLLSAMTAMNPAHRPAAADIVARLNSPSGSLTAVLPTAVVAPRARRSVTRSPLRIGLVAASVVTVAGVTVGLTTAGHRGTPPRAQPATATNAAPSVSAIAAPPVSNSAAASTPPDAAASTQTPGTVRPPAGSATTPAPVHVAVATPPTVGAPRSSTAVAQAKNTPPHGKGNSPRRGHSKSNQGSQNGND